MSDLSRGEYNPDVEKSERPSQKFLADVEAKTGLKLNRIPDAVGDQMWGDSILSSGSGDLVYGKHIIGKNEDGTDITDGLEVAYIVNRSKELPPADLDADGLMQKK